MDRHHPRPRRPHHQRSLVPATKDRLVSLDVFRGITVAGMLLVNDPGSWGHIYPPLEHAAWNGWTPTDLVFPFFLFIVGITTVLSANARRARGATDAELVRQIVRRGALIFLFGLLVNWLPFYTWSGDFPSFGARIVDRLYHVRIMGVLQRIGLAYIAGALIALRASTRAVIGITATILLGYWAVISLGPLEPAAATVAASIDRALLDWGPAGNHLWAQSETWDPEGPLSTIPAIATVLLGVLAGRWIASGRTLAERLNGLFAAGAIAMSAGLVWNWVFPINKNLWTSSYVVFTAGMAAVTLAVCIWLIDSENFRWWTPPVLAFGMNPIVAFVGSAAMERLIYSVITLTVDGKSVSLETAIYNATLGAWLPPQLASLSFAVCFVLVWLGVLTVLYRRKIFLKI
jgi:predicted acyltransferase